MVLWLFSHNRPTSRLIHSKRQVTRGGEFARDILDDPREGTICQPPTSIRQALRKMFDLKVMPLEV